MSNYLSGIQQIKHGTDAGKFRIVGTCPTQHAATAFASEQDAAAALVDGGITCYQRADYSLVQA